MIQNIKSQVLSLIKERQLLIGLVILSGIIALLFDLKETEKPKEMQRAEAATFIPDGFVLVPIELQNAEVLDSILGSHGVVDLFTVPGEGGGSPEKVAQKIKILRAPLNPGHFAVLAPENEAPNLVRRTGPFSAVIQNPKENGTNFVKAKKAKSRVTVEFSE